MGLWRAEDHLHIYKMPVSIHNGNRVMRNLRLPTNVEKQDALCCSINTGHGGLSLVEWAI